jgi:hypothetical protein
MKYSLNSKQLLLLFTNIISHKSIAGLVGHIKTHFPAMYRLYIILKDQTELLTDDELAIALAEKVLDVEAASANLLSMFAKQSQENLVSKILLS